MNEIKIEQNNPPFWKFAIFTAFWCAVVAAALFLSGKAFSPQAFADSAQTRAEIPAQVAHLEEMNTLTEQDTANRLAETAKRRAFWTGAMLAIAFATALTALGLGFRVTAVSVARGVQALRQIPHQPLPLEMRNGYTALPAAMTGNLLDEHTGRVSEVGETAESAGRVRLEQVERVTLAAVEAARRDKRAGDWLNGILQEAAGQEVTK